MQLQSIVSPVESQATMRALSNGGPRPRNYILLQMPELQFAAISRFLVPVDLPLYFQLSQPNHEIEHVFFLTSGLISTDALTEGGDSVEVGLTGREGGVLGHPQTTQVSIMQGPGFGYRQRLAIFRDEVQKGGSLLPMVHNRLHPVEARLASWLLTSADRTESETLQPGAHPDRQPTGPGAVGLRVLLHCAVRLDRRLPAGF